MLPLGGGRNLGMDEDDHSGFDAVPDLADQLAVGKRFVAKLPGVVAYLDLAHRHFNPWRS